MKHQQGQKHIYIYADWKGLIESGSGLSLNISGDNNSLDLNLAKEVAEYFRINTKESDEIIALITSVVKGWTTIAAETGISRSEQELMSNAFKNA
ncbi:MAG: hypothetical protein U5K32_00270 [Bacteroidales bacterium]|nr:hypothetical protein [Bacteroidales bacterium]